MLHCFHRLFLPVAVLLLSLVMGCAHYPVVEFDPEFAWEEEDPATALLSYRAQANFQRGAYKRAGKEFERLYDYARRPQNRGMALCGQAVSEIHRHKAHKAVEPTLLAVEHYAHCIDYEAVVRGEWALARLLDRKPSFWGFVSHRHLAVDLYESIFEQAPYTPLAPAAMRRRIQLALMSGDDFERGVDWLQDFLARYPEHEATPHLRQRLVQVWFERARLSASDLPLLRRIRFHTAKLRAGDDKELSAWAAVVEKQTHEIEAEHYYRLGKFYEATEMPAWVRALILKPTLLFRQDEFVNPTVARQYYRRSAATTADAKLKTRSRTARERIPAGAEEDRPQPETVP